MLDSLFQDIRYGVRALAARPGFALAALTTLALAIGANTLVFSLIDGIYLSPLPYRDDAKLVDIENQYRNMGLDATGASIPDYLDRREGMKSIVESGLFMGENFNLAIDGAPERAHGIRATPSLFATLGVAPALGRAFTDGEAEPGADRVVVLGDAMWRNRFGADPAIVGRDIRLDGESYRVVGVMPRGFMFPDRETALYVPFAFTPAQKADTERGHEFSTSIARLAPGATIADAENEANLVVRRNLDRLGSIGSDGTRFATFMKSAGFTIDVRPLRTLLAGDHSRMLLLLQLAVGLVLLIACANIANLMLTRLSARQKELSVRTALGASRSRLARQLLIEAVLLALAGAALGIVIAIAGQKLVAMSGLMPDWVALGIDLPVLAFTFAIAFAAGLLFGLAPMLSAGLAKPQQVLREAGRLGGGGRGARATRGALVVAQIALAIALLASAGLLVRSFANVLQESPGFDSRGVLTAAISLSPQKYPDDSAKANVIRRILESARALPGAAAVGLIDERPMSGAISGSSYRITGVATDATPHAFERTVDEDYFKAMGIPLIQGRTFESSDWTSANKVAVVDELFAKKRFPNGDAVGHVLDLDRPGVTGRQYTIVGVVGTTKNGDLGETVSQETFYLDYGQSPAGTLTLILRTAGPPGALVQPLREAVRSVDPEQPLFDVMTLDQRVHLSLTGRRVPMQLIGLFAALALVLAAIGIYGVLAFAVAQRTGEFGVRMAIGADAGRIRRQVLADGARLLLPGLAIGVAGAIALGFVLRSQLFGVGAIDVPSLGFVVAVLGAIALLACWVPARRAAKTAPLEALRYE
ncbi:MAG TPA: ABC transporter permease [Rhodanobacteraceae bacterium]|nr:ABC transporter permease [Rhodanobacteraceae bacterium]